MPPDRSAQPGRESAHTMTKSADTPLWLSFTALMMSRNDTFVLGALSVSIAMFVLGVGFGLLLGC